MILKQKPEDFVVEELIDLDQTPGKYLYVKVKKRNLNTLDIVNMLMRELHIPRRDVSYAGSKDKVAITTQYFSIFNGNVDRLKEINLKDVEITPLHSGSKPISLGSLIGNNFRIKVIENIKEMNFMVNYFGEQRFSENNAEVGKAILMKDFKLACSLVDNRLVNKHLEKVKTDFIGALQKLDKKLLSLYIHAYQSYLWNEVVKTYLIDGIKFEGYMFVKEKGKNINIPLVAFDTIFKNKEVEKIYTALLEKENLKLRDFIIRSFPDAMPISTERKLFVDVKDYKREKEYVEFTLPKGSYATIFLKQLESFL